MELPRTGGSLEPQGEKLPTSASRDSSPPPSSSGSLPDGGGQLPDQSMSPGLQSDTAASAQSHTNRPPLATAPPLPNPADEDSPLRLAHDRDLVMASRLLRTECFSQGLWQWIYTYLRLQEWNITGNTSALRPEDVTVLEMAAQLPPFTPPLRPYKRGQDFSPPAAPEPKRQCGPTPAPPARPPAYNFAQAVAASPPSLAPSARPLQPSAGQPQAATAANTDTAAAAAAAPMDPPRRPRYPPLVVEKLPDWPRHLAALAAELGSTPNARPYANGVRFTPASGEEYRCVQQYLTELHNQDNTISWFSYFPPDERKLKVAIRRLPVDTDITTIQAALKDRGFEAEYVKSIRARSGRPGCIYFAQLAGSAALNSGIYDVRELLCMPGVKIEAWRGKKGPAQCHRCQQFRHSSHNCHRPIACVRCGEAHAATNCPRPRVEPATCANCGGPHPANHAACPVFRREARNKRAGTIARTIAARPGPETRAAAPAPMVEESAPFSLMAPANAPRPRGAVSGALEPTAPATKKKKKKRKRASAASVPADPTAPKPNARAATLPGLAELRAQVARLAAGQEEVLAALAQIAAARNAAPNTRGKKS